MSKKPHILIIDAPYYEALSKELRRGAIEALEAAGATYNCVSVPGVLEIPTAVAMAITAAENGSTQYDGYVTLGVVIRGETTHYDVVAGESARAIMDLCVSYDLALGNGIQTVENEAQAWARANVSEKNKGGGAAEAALAMINLRETLSA
jgi:6,7-dimethyl-8-ribityllumazine synthase